MKKIVLLSMFLLVALAVNCFALTTPADVTVGSSTQMRSNPDADEADDRNVYDTEIFTITNTQPTEVSVTLTYPTDSKYNISVSETMPISLAAAGVAGASKSITIKSRIPEDLPSFFSNDVNRRKENIGNLAFRVSNTSGVIETPSIPLYLQAENFLVIDKVHIKINDGSLKSYDDGDTVKDLKPGDILEITVKVKNRYSDNDPENLDFDSATVTVLSENSDIDIDDDQDVDVNSKSTEEVVFDSVEIPFDASDDTSDFIVTIDGEDDNNAKQGEQVILQLEINKESNEIAAVDLPKQIDLVCNDNIVDLDFTLVNVGSKDQDEVEVSVASTDFQFQERRKDITLDEGDEESLSFAIPVEATVKSGLKRITIATYYDQIKKSHDYSVLVNVPSCTVTPPVTQPEDKEDNEVTVIKTNGTTTTPPTVPPIIAGTGGTTATVEGGFSNVYIIILVAAIIVVLLAFILTIVLLARGNRRE